jgi:hypothetical protein
MIQIPNDWFSHEFSSVWGPSDVALQRPRPARPDDEVVPSPKLPYL